MRVYYSSLLKRYIDLDSITAISDASLLPDESGPWVGFSIWLKLHNDPMSFIRPFSESRLEMNGNEYQQTNGVWIGPRLTKTDEPYLLAVENLQREIELLVAKWIDKGPGRLAPEEE